MIFKVRPGIRQQIFFGFLAAACLLLLITWPKLEKQNSELLKDAQSYQQAEQLIKNGRFAEAAPLLSGLSTKHNYSYQIPWRYGVCLAAQGKWKESVPHLERACKIRPALLTDPIFLVQFGEVLYRTGDKNRAQRYFQETVKYGAQTETGKIAAKFLQQMES